MTATEPVRSRTERRRERTRTALVRAAQALIAEGRQHAAILEITQRADVGLGSFYNHFASREALFQAAVDDVLDRHGALMDHLTAGIEDPAMAFAQSFRITGRMIRRLPQLASVMLADSARFIHSERGLAPRALRDITAAADAGRFQVRDPELSLMLAVGALTALGLLLSGDQERDGDATTDAMTEELLRAFGLSAPDAADICSRALPDLEEAVAAVWAA
jgi:AcrR family transcriptional regulator